MFKKLIKIISVIIMLFIVLILFLFYRQYPFSNKNNNLQPSNYEKIIEQTNKNNCFNLKESEKFVVDNKNIYGTLTALNLSKKYILCNNFDRAFIQLNNSLKYTEEENLKNILQLRIAKIKTQIGQYQQAINILNNIQNENWNNIVHHMKGDIFTKINNNKLAKKYWKKSLDEEESNASKEIITMKINELNE